MANGLDKDKWLKVQPSKRKADKDIDSTYTGWDFFYLKDSYYGVYMYSWIKTESGCPEFGDSLAVNPYF